MPLNLRLQGSLTMRPRRKPPRPARMTADPPGCDHLTTVFHRFMKTTPAAYREEVLGIRDPEACARTTQTS
jgi:hypothetical protein